MLELPSVSIIVPFYNHAQYLDECIDSVLAQTHKDWKLIIIDDKSTDENTKEAIQRQIARNPNISCVFGEKNVGPGACRNIGIERCDTEFIVTLDADNKLRPQYLEKMLTAIVSGLGDFIYCGFHKFADNKSEDFCSRDFCVSELLANNYIDTCSLFQKKHWEQVGGWDEIIIGWEDWDFWVALVEIGCKGYRISEILFDYRLCHNSAVSNVFGNQRKYMDRMIRKHPNLKGKGGIFK